MKKIGLASDHAGYALKEHAKEYLSAHHIEYIDYGTHREASCDYPDYGHALGQAIDNRDVATGIAICGSGEATSTTLNKHQHVRAALCWQTEIAHLARQHNDANVLVMPGRFLTLSEADAIMDEFLTTPFEGGRHMRRIEKIPCQG